MKRITTLTVFTLIIVSLFSFETVINIENPHNLGKDHLLFTKEENQPAVPYISANILVPQGYSYQDIDIDYIGREITDSAEYEIMHEFMPISSKRIPRQIDVSKIKSSYPQKEYQVLGEQVMNGFNVIMLNIFPYKYHYEEKKINYNSKIKISLELTKTKMQNASKVLKTEKIFAKMQNLVVNPEEYHRYQQNASRLDRELPSADSPFSYIIISSAEKEEYFADFSERKETQGLEVGFFSTEDIYANYDGVDNADRIRNFIIDAYEVYATTTVPLEYVLLGGDDEIIPYRGVYGEVGSTVDFSMPADLYFGCLDGTWDANENGIYGEAADNPDMIPELAVGRIPAESETQFNNFFNKTEYYEEVDSYSNDIAYMYGENLNWNPVTWGGDYKDEIIPYIPEDFHVSTLYQRDGNFDVPNVIGSINSGLGIINHMGHANYNFLFGFNTNALSQMTNTEYGFAYSQGCYPAAFDDVATNGSECIAEEFVTRDIGLFAFVGNTRYGWYAPGSTNGASQAYDHTFFQALFDEDIRELGHALNWSKTQLLNSAMESTVMRWVYYEMILFGDPAVAIKDANGTYPYLEPVDYSYSDNLGDDDGNLNPGETVELDVTIRNQIGWQNAFDAYAILNIPNENIEVVVDSIYFGEIPAGNNINSGNVFQFVLSDELPLSTYEISIDIFGFTFTGETFTKSYNSEFSVNLNQPNWPWSTISNIDASPIIINIDDSPEKEIVINDVNGGIHFIDINAQPSAEIIETEKSILKSSAVADLNSDGNMDIITSSYDGFISAYEMSGEIIFEKDEYPHQTITPVVADIDNNGSYEILSFGLDKNLVVLDNQGNPFSDFPISFEYFISNEIAVGDINGDSAKEIVLFTNNGVVHAIDINGDNLPGFPVQGSSSNISPIILDNGNIFVGHSNGDVKIIDGTGEIIMQTNLDYVIKDSPVAADLDDDSQLDIVFNTQNGYVCAINQAGEYLPNFPVEIGEAFSIPPIIADIDNDSILDIISMSYFGNMFIVKADGTQSALNPIVTSHTAATPSAVDDIDNDGDFDIVSGFNHGITVVDLKSEKGDKIPWSMYRGNLQRTGAYVDNIISNTNDNNIEVPESISLKNYPNPFNPSTKISFNLTSESEVRMDIFNIRGQLVNNLINEKLNSGKQVVTWNGKDNEMKSVGSGVYFIRLKTNNDVTNRKILLLK